ncbi:MAG: hypothetical protein COB04_17325 [Gammaproteobacteria bacterium]|nr:MAG: hypothetical protein COB04_17325 [Gammaproteobacteria bacterium]
METSSFKGSERRKFVRIQSMMTFRYQILSEHNAIEGGHLEQISESNNVGRSLVQINNQLEPLLLQNQGKQRELFDVLRLLNNKINLIVDASLDIGQEKPGAIACTGMVCISACGISFQCSESVATNDLVWLELTLEPSAIRVVCTGQVVRSERIDSKQTMLALDFVHLHDADREMLIQFVVRCQAAFLRERRREREEAGGSSPIH